MINAGKICSKRGILKSKLFKSLTEKYRKALNIRLANVEQTVSTLSGGNQQKVVIAKWMEMAPQIILFDEPTRGIDIGAKAEIYGIMSDFVQKGRRDCHGIVRTSGADQRDRQNCRHVRGTNDWYRAA